MIKDIQTFTSDKAYANLFVTFQIKYNNCKYSSKVYEISTKEWNELKEDELRLDFIEDFEKQFNIKFK